MIGGEQVHERPHVCINAFPRRQIRRADRLHLHRLLDAMVAGRQELPLALHGATLHLGDLHTADAADADRIEMLLMAENRDRVPRGITRIGLGGGVVNRGGSRHRTPLGVAQNLPLRVGLRHRLRHRHLAAVDLDRDLLLEIGRGDLVHPHELTVDVAGEEAVLLRQD